MWLKLDSTLASIEKAFGVNMDTLMRMQAAYDIAQACKGAGKIHVQRYHPASAHP